MKLFKYTANIEHLESYLSHNIWLSPLVSLNDPYEGRFRFKSLCPSTVLTKPELLNYQFEFHLREVDPNVNINDFKAIIASPEFQVALENHKSTVTDIFSSHGVTCFTEREDNMPMWAHYGGQHTGYCVEFSIDLQMMQQGMGIKQADFDEYIQEIRAGKNLLSFHKDQTPIHFVFLKVNYNKMPTIDFNEFLALQDDFSRIRYIATHSIGVKQTSWGYEEEFRLVANANSKDFGSLPLFNYVPFLKVTAIIMGCATNENTKQEIKWLTKKYNIALRQSSHSASEYTMDKCEIAID